MMIVVLSFNHPQLTSRCVRSALEFSRVLLVHNGSRQDVVDSLKNEFPEVDHLVLEKNRGFSGGANAGIQQALKLSDWIFFLTNDCELLTAPRVPQDSGLIAPLIWRRKQGHVDSLGGRLLSPSGRLIHCREYLGQQGQHGQHGQHGHIGSFERGGYQSEYIPGTSFWIDRETFIKTRGFDERLGTYWEDVELSLRGRRQGIRLGIDERTEVLHKVGKTCHKDAHYTTYLFQRNRIIVAWRYFGWARFLFLFFYFGDGLRFYIRRRLSGQKESAQLVLKSITDGWRSRNLLYGGPQ